ncbi:MAG TPA: DNA topoisomerase IV subunit A [Sporichthyaceae bacterium]|nr:DNA topoisomerase IV subunit A [Sporichthyaceae bacterium]
MATTPPPTHPNERILITDVAEEMRGSFLEYAYSVIWSRALPDARDGLKPVHRRILYQMAEMGLRPDTGTVKSARVVGEVMGRLHPHGDGAIYDALVRMVQPFAMRLPTIHGQGNFGTLDDGPAAMRYTECRLAEPAMDLVRSIHEGTVDFAPNYDSRESEPTVLPAAFPNLLVNGAAGIAVGMATNMAPHNLGEVIAAARHLIAHPDADLDALMRFVPGPDLPTGGKIVGLEGVREAYETGRGSFRMRATTHIENVTARQKAIVVTELPYGVGTEKVITRIKDLVNARKLAGIAAVDDHTDGTLGLRLEIKIKTGFNPEAVLAELYRQTPLEDSFAINAVALVDGQPLTLGLKELLQVYLEHRFEVVRRRSEFRRQKAADRLHLVDGLLVALLNIDEVIGVIRTSDDTADARARLMQVFDLTQIQADYILDTPLRRLTRYDSLALEREQSELRASIEELTALLQSDALLRKTVSTELKELSDKHADARRTVLLESAGVPTGAVPLEVTDDPCWVLLSSAGLLARTANADPLPAEGNRAKHDVVTHAVATTARGQVGAVTNLGRMLRVSIVDLPALPPTAAPPTLSGGGPVSEFCRLEKGERVVALASLDPDSPTLALGTASGVVKRLKYDVPGNKDDWEVIALKPGDTVVGAGPVVSETAELVFLTDDAQLLRFPAGSVTAQGRTSAGMAGIRTTYGARVAWFGVVDPLRAAVVVTVSGSTGALDLGGGSIKVTPFEEYPGKGRGTGGVRCHRFLRGEDVLTFGAVAATPARAADPKGTPLDLPEADGRRDGSGIRFEQVIAAAAGPLA